MFDNPDDFGFGSRGVLSFRLWGVPIQIRPIFWLVAILLSPFFRMGNQIPDSRILFLGLLAWVAAWLLNFLIHEMGHALTIRLLYGARPRIILYGFGGVTLWQPYYSRVPAARGRILTSFAGPGLGIAVVLLTAGIFALSGVPVKWGGTSFGPIPIPSVSVDIINSLSPGMSMGHYLAMVTLEIFINSFLWMGLFWGVLNLLPIDPLDGGHIARSFLGGLFSSRGERIAVWLSFACAVALGLYCVVEGNIFMAIFFGLFAQRSWRELQST
ncbi:MAG: metalloprotease [Thermoguttaceae bacterium]|jgi:stage IV sporulation protein FB